jgi:hypothetical protein
MTNQNVNQIYNKHLKEVRNAGVYFHGAIVKAWPVDTGRSRRAWDLYPTPDGISVFNGVSYSGVLWNGRVFNGKWYGSEQMPNGGQPILDLTKMMFKGLI